MKNIFVSSFSPPYGFVTEKYCCFPTDSEFYQSDYEAVMASTLVLRVWSDSDRPSDDFTSEENKEDLAFHEEDNENHSAYGYMLYNPEKTYCFGSLYINPLDSLRENYIIVRGSPSLLTQLDARVDYWIRSGEEKANTELTKEIVHWLVHEWKINVAYVLREKMEEKKNAYIQAGLREKLALEHKETKTRVYIYCK
jgi:hypothetical protein